MNARKGKAGGSRSAIDNVLDDLLASDEDDFAKKASTSKHVKKKDKFAKGKSKLTSELRKPSKTNVPIKETRTSDAEFYRNLKSIGGQAEEDVSEEEELSEDATRKLTENIGDLDDLDNDLFAGLGSGKSSKKQTTKKESSREKKQTGITKKSISRKVSDSSYDPSDPLADLGLTDEEELQPKKKSPHKKPLSKRLSNEKLKIQPSVDYDDNEETPNKNKLDMTETFTSTHAKGGKLRHRQSSWDESDADTSPRHATPASKKKSSRRKTSIEPTTEDEAKVNSGKGDQSGTKHIADDLFDDDTGLPGFSDEDSQPKKSETVKNISKGRGTVVTNRNKDEDEIFGESEGLPGFSDEEEPVRVNNTSKKSTSGDGIMPKGKASSALTSLLSNSSPSKTAKKSEPTMLEQLMSGKSITKQESPRGSPSRKSNLTFGGYSPSIGSDDRPLTAPTSRGVRFADELGLDLDDSLTRPTSAPQQKQSKSNLKTRDSISLESSLDESDRKAFAKDSRRSSSSVKKGNKSSGKSDDWLGLGDDLTDQLGLNDTYDLLSPRRNKKTAKDAARNKKDEIDLTLPWESKPKKTENTLQSKDDNAKINEATPKPSNSVTEAPISNGNIKQSSPPKPDGSTYLQSSHETRKDEPKSGNVSKNSKEKEAEDDFLSLLQRKKKPRENINVRREDVQEVDGNITREVGNKSGKAIATDQNNNYISLQPSASMNTTQDLASQFLPDREHNDPTQAPDVKQQVSSQPQKMSIPQVNMNLQLHEQQLKSQQQKFLQQQMEMQLLQQQQQQHLRTLPLNQPETLNSSYSDATNSLYKISLGNPSKEVIEEIKMELKREIEKQYQEEFNASRRQFDRDKGFVESELKELQQKILKMEEVSSHNATDYQSTIRDLETKLRKLELENNEMKMSRDNLIRRHKDEMEDLEKSHKTRLSFVEDSCKRREKQLQDEHDIVRISWEEKLKYSQQERDELDKGFKRKQEILVNNHVNEIDRLKGLHKKSIEQITRSHEDEMNRLRLVKEKEVSAAVDAFSHTKSLKSLMEEVQHSTREVSTLQHKIDASYQSKLEEREMSLKSREEYVRNLEKRLQQQETQNNEERQRLQSLVTKMEVQIRDQARKIEDDRWQLSQSENKLKTWQSSFEEERRLLNEQFHEERQQLTKSREDILSEQRSIMSQCYEEKKQIAREKSELMKMQREIIQKSNDDRNSTMKVESELETTLARYQQEASMINSRLVKLKHEEEALYREKEEFIKQQKILESEFEKLNEAAKNIQAKSEEIEEFAKDAKRVYDDGINAMEEAHMLKAECMERERQHQTKQTHLDQVEKNMEEEKRKLEKDRSELKLDRENLVCLRCKGLVSGIPPHQQTVMTPANHQGFFPQHMIFRQPAQLLQQPHPGLQINSGGSHVNQHFDQSRSQANVESQYPQESSLEFSKTLDMSQTPELLEGTAASPLPTGNTYSGNNYITGQGDQLPPPDILLNNFEFKREMRKWSAAKEKADNFFEEETRYLQSLQEKRLR